MTSPKSVKVITLQLAVKLQELYASSTHIRIFLNHLAGYGKNPKNGYSSIEQVLSVLANQARPSDARYVLKQLEAAGCGIFKVGRRGLPPRLVWCIDAVTAGKMARGDDDAIAHGVPGILASRTVEFPLREGLTVTMELPKDLTEREAVRLSTFLHAVVLEHRGSQVASVEDRVQAVMASFNPQRRWFTEGDWIVLEPPYRLLSAETMQHIGQHADVHTVEAVFRAMPSPGIYLRIRLRDIPGMERRCPETPESRRPPRGNG